MSTDYMVFCAECKEGVHLGQRYAGSDALSFAWHKDDKEGQRGLGRWMLDRLESGCVLTVMATSSVPLDVKRLDFKDGPNNERVPKEAGGD